MRRNKNFFDTGRSGSTFIIILSILVFSALVFSAPVFAQNLTPAEIKSAIRTQLKHERGIPAHSIKVKVEEGTAILDGTVDNLLARERAAEVAGSIRGVRAVVNQIDIQAEDREDEALKADIREALAIDPAAEAFEIEIQVRDGAVTLTGEVDSWAEKRLAGKVAKGVRGVEKFTNNLDVESRTQRPDREIRQEIQERLAWDLWIDDALIEVAVTDRVVELSGAVGSLLEKTRALNKARVVGVQAVDSEKLTVNWLLRDEMRKDSEFQAAEDEKIESALKTAFRNDPRVKSFNVTPMVEDGVVTLTGVVDNLEAKRAAARDAQNTVGVWRVKNFLRVRPDRIGEDDTLENRIQKALKRSPDLHRFDVVADVKNAKAYLYGSVDSRYEAARAEEVVSGVKGVVAVDNNIDISDEAGPESDDIVESDRELKENVISELRSSPYVDADTIIVTVEDGVVTLAGNVTSIRELNVAAQNAREAGAEKVVNLLDFTYGPTSYY
ncbi:MAG: BON domain-containing protein [Thermodesulfobacteriota bacterium]